MRIADIALLVALAVTAPVPVLAQQPPTENKGMKADVLSSYALGKQGLEDYAQRQIRMRRITVEPGGTVGFHSHAQRPALTYVLSGVLTEHRKGSPDRTYNPGEVITESTDVDHWAENKAGEPVVLISVDLFKE
jgi:quercetin dioxygenase-like cupin family protein